MVSDWLVANKARTASTVNSDAGTTLVTKDYLEAVIKSIGGGGGGVSDIADRLYTKSGDSSVACNTGDIMLWGGCYATDNCSDEDWSGHGGYPSGQGFVCGTWHCNSTTAYVRCLNTGQHKTSLVAENGICGKATKTPTPDVPPDDTLCSSGVPGDTGVVANTKTKNWEWHCAPVNGGLESGLCSVKDVAALSGCRHVRNSKCKTRGG